MRSSSVKAGSGRIVVALLGLLFMKALGDVLIAPGGTRGRQAEAIEPMPSTSGAVEGGPIGHGARNLATDAAPERNAAN